MREPLQQSYSLLSPKMSIQCRFRTVVFARDTKLKHALKTIKLSIRSTLFVSKRGSPFDFTARFATCSSIKMYHSTATDLQQAAKQNRFPLESLNPAKREKDCWHLLFSSNTNNTLQNSLALLITSQKTMDVGKI